MATDSVSDMVLDLDLLVDDAPLLGGLDTVFETSHLQRAESAPLLLHVTLPQQTGLLPHATSVPTPGITSSPSTGRTALGDGEVVRILTATTAEQAAALGIAIACDRWPARHSSSTGPRMFLAPFPCPGNCINTQSIKNCPAAFEVPMQPGTYIFTSTGRRCYTTTHSEHTFKAGQSCAGHMTCQVSVRGLAYDTQHPGYQERGVKTQGNSTPVPMWRNPAALVLYSEEAVEAYVPKGKGHRGHHNRQQQQQQQQQQQLQRQDEEARQSPSTSTTGETSLLPPVQLSSVILGQYQQQHLLAAVAAAAALTSHVPQATPATNILPNSSGHLTAASPQALAGAPAISQQSPCWSPCGDLAAIRPCSLNLPPFAQQLQQQVLSEQGHRLHQQPQPLLDDGPLYQLLSSGSADDLRRHVCTLSSEQLQGVSDRFGRGILHQLVTFGKDRPDVEVPLACLEALLQRIGDDDFADLLAATNNNGATPLHTAVYFADEGTGGMRLFELLLQQTPVVDLVVAESNRQWTVLHVAAGNAKHAAARLCVQRILGSPYGKYLKDVVFFDLNAPRFKANDGPAALRAALQAQHRGLSVGVEVLRTESRAQEAAHMSHLTQMIRRWRRCAAVEELDAGG